jgi:hypothetical protein
MSHRRTVFTDAPTSTSGTTDTAQGINEFLARPSSAPPTRRRHISRSPGPPRTTRDNRSQLPHPTTNHDHGLTGPDRTGEPGEDHRTGVRVIEVSWMSTSEWAALRCSASPTRRPVASRLNHSGYERTAQPWFVKARAIQVEDLRALECEQVTKIGRSPGINRTRVRAKMRVTPPRMHRCPDLTKGQLRWPFVKSG